MQRSRRLELTMVDWEGWERVRSSRTEMITVAVAIAGRYRTLDIVSSVRELLLAVKNKFLLLWSTPFTTEELRQTFAERTLFLMRHLYLKGHSLFLFPLRQCLRHFGRQRTHRLTDWQAFAERNSYDPSSRRETPSCAVDGLVPFIYLLSSICFRHFESVRPSLSKEIGLKWSVMGHLFPQYPLI